MTSFSPAAAQLGGRLWQYVTHPPGVPRRLRRRLHCTGTQPPGMDGYDTSPTLFVFHKVFSLLDLLPKVDKGLVLVLGGTVQVLSMHTYKTLYI